MHTNQSLIEESHAVLDALWNYLDTMLSEKRRKQEPEVLSKDEIQLALNEIRSALNDILPVQEQALIEEERARSVEYSPIQQEIADIFRNQVVPANVEPIRLIREEGQVSRIGDLIAYFMTLDSVKRHTPPFFPPDVFEVFNYELTRGL